MYSKTLIEYSDWGRKLSEHQGRVLEILELKKILREVAEGKLQQEFVHKYVRQREKILHTELKLLQVDLQQLDVQLEMSIVQTEREDPLILNQ
jgi:hypothetical protein